MAEQEQTQQGRQIPEKLENYDVLLVMEKGNYELKAVIGQNADGTPKTTIAIQENSLDFLKIDKQGNQLNDFFSNFFNQVKEPDDYRFFSISAQNIEATVDDLKDVIKNPEEYPAPADFIEEEIYPYIYAPREKIAADIQASINDSPRDVKDAYREINAIYKDIVDMVENPKKPQDSYAELLDDIKYEQERIQKTSQIYFDKFNERAANLAKTNAGSVFNKVVQIELDKLKAKEVKKPVIDTLPNEQKKFSYQDFKDKVSILQVAESLGYKLDEKSTTLRTQLKDATGDIILLSRGGQSNQMYRNQKNDTDKGTVIDFVKNRLERFNVSFRNETDGINKVLSGFIGTAYNFDESQKKYGVRDAKPFNIADYPAVDATVPKLHYLTQQRNLSVDTINRFLPFIKLVGNTNNQFKNVGFPYSIPGNDTVKGYELRNYGTPEKGGFKGFTTGGDKVNAVWLANLAPDKSAVKNVFFAESAIDAMSFYELNKSQLDMKTAAFVSTGGSIALNQINNVMKEFPQAKFHGCFDNDRAGQLYNITLAVAADKKELTKIQTTDSVNFKIDGKEFNLKNEDISLKNFEKNAGFKSSIKVHIPVGGKDFNEVLSKKNELNPVVKPKL